jgi:acetyl-CoA carboxylase carboxyl transferase subunit alpha
MKTAEKFKLPVFTFVDTPGAYPGIDAEERGQSEAIGRNIFEMAQLEVPIITRSSARAAPAARWPSRSPTRS